MNKLQILQGATIDMAIMENRNNDRKFQWEQEIVDKLFPNADMDGDWKFNPNLEEFIKDMRKRIINEETNFGVYNNEPAKKYTFIYNGRIVRYI